MTEAEKYQGAFYVPPKGKGANKNNNNQARTAPAPTPAAKPAPVEEQKAEKAEKAKIEKKSKSEKGLSLSKFVKSKPSSLYKIVKDLEKVDSKKSKKDILKDLLVEQKADGSIVLTLKQE